MTWLTGDRRSQPKRADLVGASCDYCGRKIARNRRPYVSKMHRDGAYFVGHRACYMELRYPDDPRLGHARHDIAVGR